MSPDVIFGSIGVVLFVAVVFEVWKYVRGHPQALASVEKELANLKGQVSSAVSTDTAAIHAKLDTLVTKVDATHAAVLAPVSVTVVPATPAESITDKLFPQAGKPAAPATPIIYRDPTTESDLGTGGVPVSRLGVKPGQVVNLTFTLDPADSAYAHLRLKAFPSNNAIFKIATFNVLRDGVSVSSGTVTSNTAMGGTEANYLVGGLPAGKYAVAITLDGTPMAGSDNLGDVGYTLAHA